MSRFEPTAKQEGPSEPEDPDRVYESKVEKMAEDRENEYEIFWHDSPEGYKRTIITAMAKPTYEEAAQIISVVEDAYLSEITIDAVREKS